MKLMLINPRIGKGLGPQGKGVALNAPLAPLYIAAKTPDDVEVKFYDEVVENINFDEDVDLVGITAWSATAFRAYEIADVFRKRGIKVILGGHHVSICPEESVKYADAIVIGEAENLWPKVLEDFRRNNLKRIYKSDTLPDVNNLPIPRRDLLKTELYITPYSIQTARGCPFSCKFCIVPKVYGNYMRYRPIDDVMKEIESIPPTFFGRRSLSFIDDNFFINKSRAEELLKRLITAKAIWGCQSSLMNLDDDELLSLAAESGCFMIYIGLESISNDEIRNIGKGEINQVEKYEEIIEKIHKAGIWVWSNAILGLDSDDETIFEKYVDFCIRNKIELPSFSILTPYYGTDLYYQLEKENRILTKDWSFYTGYEVVIKPKKWM